MKTSSKLSAFLAYLLLIIGWLYVFLFRRDDEFALYHAKQSVMLVIMAIAAPLVWLVAGWVISLIPFVGFIIAVAVFSLVIMVEIALMIAWIVGMVNAWRAKAKPVPFVGSWAERMFAWGGV